MSHALAIRFWMLCIVSLASSIALSQSRTIEVEAIDEMARPLADASVMVWVMSPQNSEDPWAFANRDRIAGGRIMATTDADGKAIVDVSTLDAEAVDQPLAVTVWKKGYGAQAILAYKKARVRCWPVQRRTLQIIDADGRPAVGLKIEHIHDGQAGDDRELMRWWTDDSLTTNELGLVTLDGHPSGWLSIQLTTPEGIKHRATLNDSSRVGTRPVDFRDLVTIRLSRHGRVEGQIGSEFAQDYTLRLVRDSRQVPRSSETATSFDMHVVIDGAGKLSCDAVTEGSYWLVATAKKVFDSQSSDPQKLRPQPLNKVDVVAGQTASVAIKSMPVVEVAGRVVSEQPNSDLSNFKIVISHSGSDADKRSSQLQAIDRVQCAADGSFRCWLPHGRYQFASFLNRAWNADKALQLDIGAGAAKVSAGEMQVRPLKPVKVVWRHDYPVPNSLQSSHDNRIIITYKDNQRIAFSLTPDGYGQAYVPLDEPATAILRDMYVSPNATSTFIDRDESENFDLELITEPRGLASNVAMRGRVVDSEGKGVLGVPVTLSLNFQSIAQPNLGAMNSSIQNGLQTLDVVRSEADGSFQIPPRQILSRLTVPAKDLDTQCRITFSASAFANPAMKEVQKTVTVKPESWDLAIVEMPDLVIDSPTSTKRLTGQLLDAEDKPIPGEIVQIADKQRLIRTISDSSGQFAMSDLANSTWLLRERDWSIHEIRDTSQPATLKLNSSLSPDADATPKWQRMAKDDRQKLAKEILQAVVGNAVVGIGGVAQPVGDEFYLQPDQVFERLLMLKGPNADEARSQYASFWRDASNEQLQQLADAMSSEAFRVNMLRTLIDRKPNPDAYAQLMDSIQFSDELDAKLAERLLFDLVSTAIKLHNYGRLDPYREKLSRYLDLYTAATSKQPPQQPGAQPRRPARPNRSAINPGIIICRAMIDPDQFASNVLETVGTSNSAELSGEERTAQSLNAAIFLQLFPDQYKQLNMETLPVTEPVLLSWGEQDPLGAIEAYKQGRLTPDMLRVVSQSALTNGHPDAKQMFAETIKILAQAETQRARFSVSINLSTPAEITWYTSVSRISPEYGKQVAWLLAKDYLSGRFENNGTNILPIRERSAEQLLAIAYCLREEQPQLAQQIIERALPRALAQLEDDFEQPFIRPIDMSLITWFDPQAARDVILKFAKRLSEEQKKQQAAGRPDAQFFSKVATLATMRYTCLCGLVWNEL